MALNISNITGISSLYDLGEYSSASTGGLFWGIIIMALFIILIMRLRMNEIEDAVVASSLACFVLSIIFLNLGWLQLLWPIFFALALAGALFYKKFKPQ